MALGMPYGMQAMLKDGHKIMSGLEEAVLKNIDACKGLTQITRTSLGPNGGSPGPWWWAFLKSAGLVQTVARRDDGC